MKLLNCLYVPLVLIVGLYGCVPIRPTMIPAQVETQPPSPIFSHPNDTPVITSTETKILIQPSITLNPEQAEATMKAFLQESADCLAPCFWGITPEQTTLEEAINIFTHLGLQVKNTVLQDKDFYGVAYDFDSGFSINVILTIQNEIVRNIRLKMHPEIQKNDISREWSTFSPEKIINKYGPPSNVNFFVGRGPNPSYVIDMYFDTEELVIRYESYDLGPQLQICPLTDQIDYVRIWMGKNPIDPPIADPSIIPLEQATSLSMEEFSNLMTGDPKKACFNLKEEAFPQ